MGRVRAYIGLGANVGDAAATLAAAVHALGGAAGRRLVAVSRLYATEPVGVVDQPEFRNAVVALDVPAGPDPATGASALLVALKGIERAFGRQERERWGPREVDLDILVFGDATDRGRAAAGGPERRPREGRRSRWSCRTRRPGTGCSCSRPLADLAPGPRAARLGRDGRRGRATAGSRPRARTPSGRSRPGTARAGARSPSG